MHKNLSFGTRRLVSQDDAAIVESARVPRSRFIGRKSRLTTFDAGELVPFHVEEVYPGDHFSYRATIMIRLATALFPMMDNQRVDTFWFFVPFRLVWANWVKFMGEQANPSSSIAFTVPQMDAPVGGYAANTLQDHMGLPTVGQIDALEAYSHNTLPLRAYNLIWNTWFRDQNIQNSVTVDTDDGPDTYTDYVLQYRAKSHDYFTSALPWAQKFTAPSIPVSGQAPVHGIGIGLNGIGGGPANWYDTGGVRSFAAYSQVGTTVLPVGQDVGIEQDPLTGYPLVFADLSAATGASVNTFRQAFLVQELLERDARGGTRYVELIKSHFGVTNPDFRLQRPEYIGGGQTPLVLTPIAQTAPTAGVPLGALGAAGTAAGDHRASYAATEHGVIIALINIRSELHYQQGMHRMWSRSTRYDYYWPALAGLGEQAVLRKEIYMTGDPINDDAVFGYQERWHELRTMYSDVTGMFKSTTTGTLDAWHLAQRFTAAPGLSTSFIRDLPDMDRVLAAGASATNQQYLADIEIDRTAVRPIPTFGTPVTLGRF